MSLQVAVMGRPVVLVDGAPLRVDTRKATAILVYLAIEREPQARDHLVELLWPDTDPNRSRSSMRRTLSTLRSALGGRWVQADRTTVSFDRTDAMIDLDQFLELGEDRHGHEASTTCPRCVTGLRRAAAFIRGSFLAGFAVRGSPDFEAWALAQEERVRRLTDDVLARLAHAQASDGDYAAAIETTERRIRLDPLAEDAHRMLMLHHAWSGDRSGAVDAYRRLVGVLDTELGVAPLDETTELHEAILEEDIPRSPAPMRPVIARPDPVADPTLAYVGRDDQLGAVLEALQHPGAVVTVEIRLGVGSTRFLDEVTARLRATDATVLAATAGAASAGVPYGVLTDALFDVVADPGIAGHIAELPDSVLAEASRLFPGLTVSLPPPPETTTKARLLDAVARVIAAMPDPVMIVDDAHLADPASAEALSYLARRGERLGLKTIVAIDPGAIRDPIVATELTSLTRTALEISLPPLTPADLDALARSASVQIDAAALADETGGLPLLAVEAVRALARGEEVSAGAELVRVVRGRLRTVSGIARQVLDAVTVLGGPADVRLIAAVCGRSADETDVAIDELTVHHLVREVASEVTVAHSQVADVVAASHTAARRRLLNRRAATALEARGGVGAARIAQHYVVAGEDEAAALWFETAADDAVAVSAHREAAAHLDSAIAAGHPDRAVLYKAKGDAHLRDGRYDLALASYRTAIGGGGEDPVLEHRIGEIHRRLGQWDLARAHYDRAFDASADTDFLAVVAADRAYVEYRRGRPRLTKTWLRRATDLSETAESDTARVHTANVAGIVADDPVHRAASLERALELAGSPAERVAVLNNLAREHSLTGDTATAVATAQDAVLAALDLGDRHLLAAVYGNLADALHESGNVDESLEALRHAVSNFVEIRAGSGRQWEPEVWMLTEW